MSALRLTLDGAERRARPGQTLLDVATEAGVHVPTLCHDPRLEPEGSCWVCVVEVRRGDGWAAVPACATRAEAGMEVRTDSEAVREARRWAVELLLSDHWADCVAPCTLACPAGIDVPGYVAAVGEGRFDEAVGIVRAKNPLPAVCGRICPARCEEVCRRGLVDEPVAINPLKRLATERAAAAAPGPAVPASGRRVAVVGAGPAGLSAAWYLRLRGHAVTVFEAAESPGGMLRHAIPAYRLPREVLDADLAALEAAGVELVYGRRLGGDLTVGELADGWDAVFLALGAWKGRRLAIPGEETEGVVTGVELLRRVNGRELTELAGRVVVIGGGNTAVDAARAALRLGAGSVTIAYRRDREQMPAFPHEVEAALAEGVELRCLVAPVRVGSADGKVEALVLQRMELSEPDRSGRPRPVPVPDSEHTIAADLVVRAVGETPDRAALGDALSARGAKLADPETLATAVPGVFAGGDLLTGPSTAVEAIAAGRRAARAIDAWLGGEAVATPAPVVSRRDALAAETPEDVEPVEPRPRASPPERPPVEAARDFGEVVGGLTREQGRAEAARCLQCGCDAYDSCELRQIAQEVGARPDRLAGEVQRHRPALLRPGLRLDMNKCVRCSRCVRACRQLAEVGALELVQRGLATHVLWALAPEDPSQQRCDACLVEGGACVETCPTGALTRLEGGG